MEIMPSANIISKLLEQTMGQLEWGSPQWMEKSGGFGKILLKMLRLFPSLLVGFLFFLPFFSISLLGV